MSIEKVEIKQVHLNLIKFLKWDIKEDKTIITTEPKYRNFNSDLNVSPFGGMDVYEDMFYIIKGKPDTNIEVDIYDLNYKIYSEDDVKMFDTLLEELPLVLDVICYNQSFELGKYKTKFNKRQWVKY